MPETRWRYQQRACDVFAEVLSRAGQLTERLLTSAIPDMIMDSAISVGLQYPGNTVNWAILKSRAAHWQAKLLSSTGRPSDAMDDRATGSPKAHNPTLGGNIDRLRKEYGWSFDELSKKTGIDKKLILGQVNKGKGAHPKTLATCATAFTKALGRHVAVQDLEP